MVAINVEELTNDEQLNLIEQLWESLRVRVERDPSTLAVPESQQRELTNRMEAFRTGEMTGKPMDEALHDIRSRRKS